MTSRQRHRFDHDAALAFYVALDKPRRYVDVARAFDVSETTIRKVAKAERWVAACEDADNRAAAAALRSAVKTREQRAIQTARILDAASNVVEAEVVAENAAADFALRVVEVFAKQHRLNEGEATDNIAIATVQAGFRSAMQTAIDTLVTLVAGGLAGDGLIVAFRAEFPVAVQQRLALEEAA
jgi:hypothetical protein